MDAEGKACDKNPDQCPLQSTGFFFRESDSGTKSPGTASFVIKIEKNPGFTLVSETPIKPTYISLFVGTSWMSDNSASNTASTTNSANQDQKNCLPKGATTNIPDACCSKKAICLPGGAYGINHLGGGGQGYITNVEKLVENGYWAPAYRPTVSSNSVFGANEEISGTGYFQCASGFDSWSDDSGDLTALSSSPLTCN